jgi:hypothetical protein
MAFKMKYKNLQEVVSGLETASKTHAKQAKVVKGHIEEMEKGSAPTKMADLNNDKKITKADVLIGRGVIDEEGKPLKKTKKRTLTASCKAAAKRKFKKYPSAYANMWASRQQGQGKC